MESFPLWAEILTEPRMRDVSEMMEQIRVAAERGDSQTVAGLVMELGPNVLVYRQLPDEVFADLEHLLSHETFRSLSDSWQLISFTDDYWELLNPVQRERLRSVLADGFDRFRDYMGAFVIGEMLGRRFGDEGAFRLLDRLAESAALPARALVPHGLETLARNTGDALLREKSIRRLRELTASPTPEVREEAVVALRKATAAKK